jgi:hypothetical protein
MTMMTSGALAERRRLVTAVEDQLTAATVEELHRFMRQYGLDEYTARGLFCEAMQKMAHQHNERKMIQ